MFLEYTAQDSNNKIKCVRGWEVPGDDYWVWDIETFNNKNADKYIGHYINEKFITSKMVTVDVKSHTINENNNSSMYPEYKYKHSIKIRIIDFWNNMTDDWCVVFLSKSYKSTTAVNIKKIQSRYCLDHPVEWKWI